MKTITHFLLFSAMAILLMGCPYSSKVPVDAANEKLDKNLFGKWVKEGNDEHPEYLVISEKEGNTYEIDKFSWENEEYKQEKQSMHLTTIGNTVFMNMQKENDNNYYLHKMEIEGDKITVFEVTDNIDEKFDDSEALKEFVSKYKDLSFFYNKDEETYLRGKE